MRLADGKGRGIGRVKPPRIVREEVDVCMCVFAV